MLSHTTEIRVRYADTDQMQFVYNGKYLEYFEVGRTEMLRSSGIAYTELERAGYQLPLLESHVKYKIPARYDDILLIKAYVEEFPSFRINIKYSITRKDSEEEIAEGFTKHVFINKESKKAVRPPKEFLEKIKRFYA